MQWRVRCSDHMPHDCDLSFGIFLCGYLESVVYIFNISSAHHRVWCTSQCSRLLMAPGSLSISFLATKMPVTWVAVSILIVTLSKKFNVALSSFVFFREHSISFSFLVLDNKSYAAFSAFILTVWICSFCFRSLWKVLITIWVTQLPLQHAKCSLDLYVVHFCCITRVSTCMAWVRTGCSEFFIGTCERTS